MLRGLFPRFFGQFLHNGFIRGSFTFEDDDDSWTAVSGSRFDTANGLTVADAGTGRVTVTFPKCRQVEVLHASIRQTVGTFGNIRQIELPPMTEAIANAGTFELNIYKEDGTSGIPALADPADGAKLALVLWMGK